MFIISIILTVIMYSLLISVSPKTFLTPNWLITPGLIISIFLVCLMIYSGWYWIVTIYSIIHSFGTIKMFYTKY